MKKFLKENCNYDAKDMKLFAAMSVIVLIAVTIIIAVAGMVASFKGEASAEYGRNCTITYFTIAIILNLVRFLLKNKY